MENINKPETTTIEDVIASKTINEDKKIIKLDYSGITVSFNPKELNGHALMQARKIAGEQAVNSLSVYIASIVCLFNGERKTADEILDFPMLDIVHLEEELFPAKKQI